MTEYALFYKMRKLLNILVYNLIRIVDNISVRHLQMRKYVSTKELKGDTFTSLFLAKTEFLGLCSISLLKKLDFA
jgi:hypothetical protein